MKKKVKDNKMKKNTIKIICLCGSEFNQKIGLFDNYWLANEWMKQHRKCIDDWRIN